MRTSSASLGRVLAKRRRREDLANRVGIAGIAAGRMAVGGAVWLSPDRALRALGFDADAVELRSTATAAAVDAGDAAAFALLLLSRERADRAAMIGLGSAAGAAVAGAWLGKRLR